MKLNIFHRLLFVLATFFMMAVGTGCVEPLSPIERERAGVGTLTLQISVPSSDFMTKVDADPGTVNVDEEEKKVYKLQVWAFIHDEDGEPIAYPTPIEDPNGAAGGDVTLSFPASVIGLFGDGPVKIDIYVLGNASSVGFNGGGNSKHKEVRDAYFNSFGSGCVSSGPLPLSCCLENFDITFLRYGFTDSQKTAIEGKEKDESFTITDIFSLTQRQYIEYLFPKGGTWGELKEKIFPKPNMVLTRAVGKVCFFFAKTENVEEIKINGIDFFSGDYGLLPDNSYLFPRGDGSLAVPNSEGEYQLFSWGSSTPFALSVPATKSASLLLRNSSTQVQINEEGDWKAPNEMTSNEYYAFLQYMVTKNESAQKLVYFRESDKPLAGRIHYKRGTSDEDLYTTFDFSSLAQAFPRNSIWIVYGYFKGGSKYLELSVSVVVDWERVNFSSGLSEQIQVDGNSKLTWSNLGDNAVKVTDYYDKEGFKIIVEEIKTGCEVRGSVFPYGPKGATLFIRPEGNGYPPAFLVTPNEPVTINGEKIEIKIRNNPDVEANNQEMTLSFYVQFPGVDRIVEANSELLDNTDRYHFVRRK